MKKNKLQEIGGILNIKEIQGISIEKKVEFFPLPKSEETLGIN